MKHLLYECIDCGSKKILGYDNTKLDGTTCKVCNGYLVRTELIGQKAILQHTTNENIANALMTAHRFNETLRDGRDICWIKINDETAKEISDRLITKCDICRDRKE